MLKSNVAKANTVCSLDIVGAAGGRFSQKYTSMLDSEEWRLQSFSWAKGDRDSGVNYCLAEMLVQNSFLA